MTESKRWALTFDLGVIAQDLLLGGVYRIHVPLLPPKCDWIYVEIFFIYWLREILLWYLCARNDLQ